jgi:hypothetical protein
MWRTNGTIVAEFPRKARSTCGKGHPEGGTAAAGIELQA